MNATTEKPLRPIIVKRDKRRKSDSGFQTTTWKIAYADFVTAMMAFFLLLWLLSYTTAEQRRGIADFFNQPFLVLLAGGPGQGAAATILPGGGEDLTLTEGERARMIEMQTLREQALLEIRLLQERQRIEALRVQIEQALVTQPQLAEYIQQIRLEMVQDGLYIQVIDERDRPMFELGSALVPPHLRSILREIAFVLTQVENRVSITGHTDALPFGRGALGYSNWELSADRANASRRELMAAGLPERQIARVVGMGPSQPLLPDAPKDPRNRRISILVLTQEAEERMTRSIAGVAPTAVTPGGAAAVTIAPSPAPAPAAPVPGLPATR